MNRSVDLSRAILYSASGGVLAAAFGLFGTTQAQAEPRDTAGTPSSAPAKKADPNGGSANAAERRQVKEDNKKASKKVGGSHSSSANSAERRQQKADEKKSGKANSGSSANAAERRQEKEDAKKSGKANGGSANAAERRQEKADAKKSGKANGSSANAAERRQAKSDLPRAGAPGPGAARPPTAAEAARGRTLERDSNGGGRIVEDLGGGVTKSTDIRTGRVTVNDPKDHVVGNVADEARETIQENLAGLGELVQSVQDATTQSKPHLATGDEWRAAVERNAQRVEAIVDAVQNPGEVLNNIIRPYEEDWNSDKPERVIGRGAVDIGSMFLSGGLSTVSKAARAADALPGGRAPDSSPSAASPPRPDAESGSGGPATGSPPPGDLPRSPDSAPRAPDQQSPTDRADSAPPGARDSANDHGSRADATTPGTPSRSPNDRDGRGSRVLPTPVTQLPTLPRTNRGDSPAHRTADTSRRDTSADDDSRSGSTRRDTGTPPSRTSDGSESRQQSSDRTSESGTNASPAARDTAEAATRCATPNSFVPGTPVLLADGTYKPIEQVRLGDRVLATDPITGLTQARPVINLIPGQGLKELVRITVDTDGDQGNATGGVTATDEHPFWVANTGRWTDAEDLDHGNLLRTPDGRLLEVVAVHEWAQQQQVHNLTIEGLHTYYVNVGGQDVLTHNAGGESCSDGGRPAGERHVPDEAWDHIAKGDFKNNKASGYHHRSQGQDRFGWKTVEKDTPDSNGVYQGTVVRRDWNGNTWVQKRAQSTFFPDRWSPAQVRHAIERAFTETKQIDPATGAWSGVYRGVRIDGYYDPVTGALKTAYPVYQKGSR